MTKNKNGLENLQSDIWNASCKIRALGEVLLFQHREPALDEEDIWYGYGSILREIGEQLEAIAFQLDKSVEEPSKRGKR